MIVCVCNNVSDKTIRQAVANGAESLQEIRAQLNVGSCCGKCLPCAKTLVRECLEDAGANAIVTPTTTELRRVAVTA